MFTYVRHGFLPKALVISLLFSFISAPTISLAQEEMMSEPPATETPETPAESNSDIPDSSLEESFNDVVDLAEDTEGGGEGIDSKPAEEEMVSGMSMEDFNELPPEMESLMSFGVDDEAPTLQSQSAFTYANVTPKVDNHSGALTQQIGLDIPPGRRGMQPALALEYNNQNTADSIVGYGWTVSIPYVERMNKTGSQNLYGTAPYFSSSIDGELATSSDGVYRAKVDDGSFTSYAFSGNTWIAYDKKGTKYSYGLSDQSRQASSTEMTMTGRWMLEEIRDTNDNYVRYIYSKQGNQIYPLQIIYTGHGVSDGNITVDFASSTRPDPFTSYKLGFRVDTNYRITQITASIGGSWVRKYDLTYGSGNNGVRSLLTSIQETGKDADSAEIVLPAMTFGYVSSSTAFVAPSSGTLIRSSSWVVSDVNGNGRNDVTIFSKNAVTSARNYGVHADQTSDSSDTIFDNWCETSGYPYDSCIPRERGIRFLDVNADGKADVARGYEDEANATTTNYLYLNTYATSTGYSWTASSTWTGVIPEFGHFYGPSTNPISTGFFGEVNGDGLPDFEYAMDGATLKSHLGNGSAWDAATTTIFYPLKTVANTSGLPQNNSQLVDINADGLDDWLYSDDTTTYVHLNDGRGWLGTADSRWTIATSTYYKNGSTYYDRGMRFLDINGDGLPDFIRSYSTGTHTACSGHPSTETATISYVFLNTGSGWATSTAYTLTPITAGVVHAPSSCTWYGEFIYNEYANWIGNGQMDQDVLTHIGYSSGGSTDVTYTPTASTGTNPELPSSLLVVTKLVTTDVLGKSFQNTYAYSGGKMYLAQGPREKKFAGFNTITESTPSSVTRTYFNQGDSVNTAEGEQSDGFGQINHPYRRDILDATGAATLQKTFYLWSATTTGNSTHVALGSEMVWAVNSNGSHKDRASAYTYSTTTRDLLQQIDYGEVSGSSNGTFSDTDTDKRTSDIAYVASSSINLSVPVQKTLSNYYASTTKETKLYYDSLAFGLVDKGNETKREDLIATSTYASSTKAYNSYGLVSSSTDARGKATTYSYDAANFYPATVTNALSQASTYTYDYSVGKVAEATDPNGRKTKNVYDAVGRVKRQDQSDLATPSSYVTKSVFTFANSTTTPSSVQRTDYLNAASTTEAYEYSDGLGHVVQRRISSGSTGTTTVSDILYNSAGLVASSTLPYFATTTVYTSPSLLSTIYTYTKYDALQRPLRIENSLGVASTTYTDWSSLSVDMNGHEKIFYYNAFNDLARVDEKKNAEVYSTVYTYDAQGNLIKITDALGNVRNFAYDALGRRTSAQDLHALADGTYGEWSYSYDDAGNLIIQTDPKSQVVNRTYDDLGRLLTEDSTGAGGTEITNVYDSCTYGIGQICSASSTSALSIYAYDVLGRAISATTTIQGVSYANAYTYDRQGNIISITYPDGRVVRYAYNDAALPNYLETKPAGGSYAPALTSLDYAPTRKIASQEFGNGVKTTLTYSPAEQYRLARILTGLGGSAPASPSVSADGLISYWKLDEASGNAVDSQGSNTLINNASAVYASGKIGNAVDLEASSVQYLSISDGSQSGLDLSGDFTVSQWIKLESSGGRSSISKYDDNTSNLSYRTYLTTTEMGMGLSSNGSSETFDSFSQTFNTGTWYHVAWAYHAAAGSVEFFVNGSSIGTKTGYPTSLFNSAAAFRIGGQNAASNDALFDGMIDETGIWSRTLSGTEVAALYNSGVGATHPFSGDATSSIAQPISYWKLDESSGNAVDAAGTNTLTNNNSATFATGKINNGADLERSSSQHFSIADGSQTGLDFSTEMTVALWVKFESLPASNEEAMRFIYKYADDDGNNNKSYYFALIHLDGELKLFSSTISDSCTSGSSQTWTPSTDTWYHVAMTYATGTVKQYINGTQLGSTFTGRCTSIRNGAAAFSVGAGNSGASALDGIIDEVGVWSEALSDAEIAELYASGDGSQYPFSDSGSTEGFASLMQDRNYTYDAVGNITGILENATSTSGMAVAYEYDALNRLVTASTTAANTAPYATYYTYNALGNILDATSTNKGGESSGGSNESSVALQSASSQSLGHASADAFDISGSFTAEAWVKFDSLPSSGQAALIAGKWGAGGGWLGDSYFLAVYNDSGTYKLYAAAVHASCTSGDGALETWTPSSDTWYHLAVNYNASTRKMQLFVNGVQQGSDHLLHPEHAGTCQSSASFRVGGGLDGLDYLNGKIDEVRLYDVARTGTQIASDYDEQITGSESNLVAYYKFNGDYDDAAADDNDLTASNSPSFSGDVPFGGGVVTYPYLYEQTGYANPHAPTSIYGSTYEYDRNGNLATTTLATSTSKYSYDYANRMTQSVSSGATSTYAYDQAGQRVAMTVGSTTTIYPNKFYSITSTVVGTSSITTYATSTAYIFANDVLVATIDQAYINGSATGTPKTLYIHPDHLGSTNVVTDAAGNIVQTLDYYPYGGQRINSDANSTDRQYIGERFDVSSGLQYLNARYMDSQRGQFTSQDPMFWSQKMDLQSPQTLNSYSYASNNPISNSDPTGLLTQAQNSQLNDIRSQLQGVQSQLSSGNLSQGQMGSIQSTISSASRSITSISNGGMATLGPSYQWSPQTSNKNVIPYTPNVANGAIPVYGTDADKSLVLGVFGLISPIPGDEYLFGAATAAKFFKNAQYSEKVMQQMKNGSDVYHAFPELIKTGASVGKVTQQVGADGAAYNFLRIPGAINGESGYYTFIKNAAGQINHRFFEPF